MLQIQGHSLEVNAWPLTYGQDVRLSLTVQVGNRSAWQAETFYSVPVACSSNLFNGKVHGRTGGDVIQDG